MKQSFQITGLRCPKCAEKVRAAVEAAGLTGVSEVAVSFLAEKITLTTTSPLSPEVITALSAVIQNTDPTFSLKM